MRRKDFWLLSTVTKLLKEFIKRLSHEADGLIFQVGCALLPVITFNVTNTRMRFSVPCQASKSLIYCFLNHGVVLLFFVFAFEFVDCLIEWDLRSTYYCNIISMRINICS